MQFDDPNVMATLDGELTTPTASESLGEGADVRTRRGGISTPDARLSPSLCLRRGDGGYLRPRGCGPTSHGRCSEIVPLPSVAVGGVLIQHGEQAGVEPLQPGLRGSFEGVLVVGDRPDQFATQIRSLDQVLRHIQAFDNPIDLTAMRPVQSPGNGSSSDAST